MQSTPCRPRRLLPSAHLLLSLLRTGRPLEQRDFVLLGSSRRSVAQSIKQAHDEVAEGRDPCGHEMMVQLLPVQDGVAHGSGSTAARWVHHRRGKTTAVTNFTVSAGQVLRRVMQHREPIAVYLLRTPSRYTADPQH